MSARRVAIELSREDWERVCRGLDERWASEEAAVEELEDMATTYGEDRSEEIASCRAEQAAAMRLFDLLRRETGLVTVADESETRSVKAKIMRRPWKAFCQVAIMLRVSPRLLQASIHRYSSCRLPKRAWLERQVQASMRAPKKPEKTLAALVEPCEEKWAKSTLSIQLLSSPPNAGSRKSRSQALPSPQLNEAV